MSAVTPGTARSSRCTRSSSLRWCVVTPAARPEWYVDDDGLNDLLRAAKGRGGIVRAAGRVFVNAAAIDPWPQSE